MTVKTDLLDMVETAAGRFELPAVREIFLPNPDPSPDRDAEFGIVILEDGSAGLYYAWLGGEQSAIQEKFTMENFKGLPAPEAAGLFKSDDPCDCSVGLATINAITRSVFRQTGYNRPDSPDTFGGLDFEHGDHVGMVGYFPSLIRRLRDRQIDLTVIEKKTKFLEQDDRFRVVLDPECLRDCNKIISTAATLLNNSIDEILTCAQSAVDVVVIGPTAGFFPDPLFNRGVTAIGGTEIIDADRALDRIRRDEKMGDASRKFLVRRNNYPGLPELL